MTDRVKTDLSGLNAQTLRDDDSARRTAANSAADIVRTMQTIMHGQPTPQPVAIHAAPAAPAAPVFSMFAAPIRSAA
jgi:hypothetical protein